MIDWKVADGIFKLNADKAVTKINVFALSGKNVLSELTNSNTIEVDLSVLPKGIYVTTVVFDDKTVEQFKIIL